MTTPDLRARGLDPAHILAVTNQAVRRPGQPALAVVTPAGIRICLWSRRAADNAHAALTRVGYQLTRPGNPGRRDLAVTGWSAAGLDARLEAMRAVLCQLHDSPAATADAVIERFRSLPPGSPARFDGRLLPDARAQLLASVTGRCGIHVPHDPAFQPADTGIALRLRAAWALESVIGDLIERHLRVAAHALPLYQSLRLLTTEDQARETAIRQASVTYQLGASAADDSAHPLRRPPRPPGPDSRSPWPGPTAGGAPARQAASAFFRQATSAEAASPAAPTSDSPGRRHISARRPGPSR
jgi:hypothetical protein